MNHQKFYKEENTKCDLCNYKNECTLIQCDRLDNTKAHYIPADEIDEDFPLKGEYYEDCL